MLNGGHTKGKQTTSPLQLKTCSISIKRVGMGGGEAARSSNTLVGAQGGGSHHLGTGEPPASQPLKGTTSGAPHVSLFPTAQNCHLMISFKISVIFMCAEYIA